MPISKGVLVTDPLDALRTPVVPVAPDPVFASRLRRRLAQQLQAHHARQEAPVTDVLLRDGFSRNGTRHGDVSYITLAVPDAAAARRFYGRVLGWTFGGGQLDAEGNQVDGVVPQVGLWPGPAWREGVSSGAFLSWRVDDIAAAVETLRAGGGTATGPVARPYGREAECTDGQGLCFWLHELPSSGEAAGPNDRREGDISYLVLRVADDASPLCRARSWTTASHVADFHLGEAPVTWGLKADAPVQQSPDPLCPFELRRLLLGPLDPSRRTRQSRGIAVAVSGAARWIYLKHWANSSQRLCNQLQTAPGRTWVPVERPAPQW